MPTATPGVTRVLLGRRRGHLALVRSVTETDSRVIVDVQLFSEAVEARAVWAGAGFWLKAVYATLTGLRLELERESTGVITEGGEANAQARATGHSDRTAGGPSAGSPRGSVECHATTSSPGIR